MIKLLAGLIGWLLPILGIGLFLSELVAVMVGMLLLVTLPWRDLLESTEAQLRLLLAMGVMTLGVGQFALVSFLINYFSLPEEQLEEEVAGPVWVLPPSAFFTQGEKRRRRQRRK